MSATASRTSSIKSIVSNWAVPALASSRARTKSCSTSRMARSMPWFSRAIATSGLAPLPSAPPCDPVRCSAWACSLSAVRGERNSCAASATKFFCISKAFCTRPNKRLSSVTSGRTSSGRSWSGNADKSSAARLATWRRVRSIGASERVMAHQTASMSSGVKNANGNTALSASACALSALALKSCAICTVCSGVCRE